MMQPYPVVDEDTPLLHGLAAPPHGSSVSPQATSDDDSYPTAPYSGGGASSTTDPATDSLVTESTRRKRSLQATELRLSLDKVAFLFSPKNGCAGYGSSGNYKSFCDPTHGHTDSEDDALSLLDPYFDVTASRLQLAFQGAHPDEKNEITYDGFRAALEVLGIRCSDDSAFQKLVESIDRDQRQRVTLQQFDAAVHRLKLLHMFDAGTIQTLAPAGYQQAALSVSDFSSTRLQSFSLRRETLPEFFTAHRPDWVSVRWINLDGRDSLNLKRLAIKYRLHPLAIEDTIEGHERPKFDRYDGHLFLVFPVLRMQVLQDKGLPLPPRRRSRTYSRAPPRSPKSGSFLDRLRSMSGGTEASTMPMEEDDDDDSDDPLKLWIEHVFIFIVDNDTVITVKDGDASNIWPEMTHRLAVPYSKLRHNGAKFLVYNVLDVIVDEITRVVDSITDCLVELENQLDAQQHHFDLRSLRHLKDEIFRLPRLLKPAREVVKNLIKSKDFDETTTAYVRDVHDHVVQVLDDIDQQLQMIRLLTEEYRDAKANQMNYVMYTLTVVTTIFLPGQFLTGVYGMNFDDMPELHERYGYALFWVFAIAIAASLQLYFRYKKWI